MTKTNKKARRTQAERRAETQTRLLSVARELFGRHGYTDTSIEDIATQCDLTVRPIYHYFGSKLGLFEAVTKQIEHDIVKNIEGRINATPEDIWSGFMKNCEDPIFRQIILIDGPILLGRSRMANGAITQAAKGRSADVMERRPDGLTMSLLFGALSSAALYIAENGASPDDYNKIKALIDFHSNKTQSDRT